MNKKLFLEVASSHGYKIFKPKGSYNELYLKEYGEGVFLGFELSRYANQWVIVTGFLNLELQMKIMEIEGSGHYGINNLTMARAIVSDNELLDNINESDIENLIQNYSLQGKDIVLDYMKAIRRFEFHEDFPCHSDIAFGIGWYLGAVLNLIEGRTISENCVSKRIEECISNMVNTSVVYKLELLREFVAGGKF